MAKGRILVVEDNPSSGRALEQLLADEGYDVLLATSGLDAVVAARRWRPNAAVVALGLPDVDGLCVIRELGKLPQECPAILVTGRVELDHSSPTEIRLTDYEREAKRAGAVAYVRKPIGLDELLRKLDRHVGACAAWSA